MKNRTTRTAAANNSFSFSSGTARAISSNGIPSIPSIVWYAIAPIATITHPAISCPTQTKRRARITAATIANTDSPEKIQVHSSPCGCIFRYSQY